MSDLEIELETSAEERAELATYRTSDGPWAAMAAALSRDFTRLLASVDAARKAEREAVVAWLRDKYASGPARKHDARKTERQNLADAIASSDHLPAPSPKREYIPPNWSL